jgi:hypothetical protein
VTQARLCALVAALLAALATGVGAASASAAINQPPQPHYGPGGSNYTHDLRVRSGGTGGDAWYVFEPIRPKPKRAPIAIVMHGYGEFEGYDTMLGLIRHTVRKGTTVIYPRWQTGIATPCPGPYLIDPCIDSAVNGIDGALEYLRADPGRVQPQLGRASYFGFSFGGIVTADMANRYRSLGLPKPRAIFLDDPHDGGLTGNDEPALDDSLDGIPPSTRFECHSSADGVISEQGFGNASCNSVFPKLGSIPARNKDLALISADDHGGPALGAGHGVCAGGVETRTDAYDWGFCWREWDALRSCALSDRRCGYALGDSRRHRYIGTWSDGVPIIGLKVRGHAPIRPDPPPPRVPRPKRR